MTKPPGPPQAPGVLCICGQRIQTPFLYLLSKIENALRTSSPKTGTSCYPQKDLPFNRIFVCALVVRRICEPFSLRFPCVLCFFSALSWLLLLRRNPAPAAS